MPATAPAEIARVLHNARERALPVYIEFPRDMVDVECAPVRALPRRAVDADALAECVDEIIAASARGEAPGAGGRCRDPPLRHRERGSPNWRASSACRW